MLSLASRYFPGLTFSKNSTFSFVIMPNKSQRIKSLLFQFRMHFVSLTSTLVDFLKSQAQGHMEENYMI